MKQNNINGLTSRYRLDAATRICWYTAIFVFLAGIILVLAANQYQAYFGISFESLLFTMKLSTQGADVGFIAEMIWGALPKLIAAVILLAAVLSIFLQAKVPIYLVIKKGTKHYRYSMRVAASRIALPLSIVCLIASVYYADQVVGVSKYYTRQDNDTAVYETYYISPNDVSISPPHERKNLIYIYVESLETQYVSVEEGGTQPRNYIPQITKLAQENISFSDSEQLGGFVSVPGTTWTLGALFASQTGLPFAFPINGNSMSEIDAFAPSVVGLGDVLKQNGYTQEFLCGSDIRFAGRDKLFRGHGDFAIYDYYTAVDKGEISEDYYVWWGFEDQYLYKIAQKELLRLSESEQPFNLTMLTVDTHHLGGYVCNLCKNTFDPQLANVLMCADQQLADFISWIQQQPFYEDTVIVITGDHPRMDTQLVKSLEPSERTMFNCFINPAVEPIDTMSRKFSTMDIFPTVLGALGFEIEGNRLGLGTNMFSDTPTLFEELSWDYWFNELQKHSEYYIQTFAY